MKTILLFSGILFLVSCGRPNIPNPDAPTAKGGTKPSPGTNVGTTNSGTDVGSSDKADMPPKKDPKKDEPKKKEK